MTGRVWSRCLAVLLAVALLAAEAGETDAQQGGTLTGRVTVAGGGEPIAGAQVLVTGTSVGTRTDQQGRFTLRGVPTRQVTVRAGALGYSEQARTVTVTATGTTTLDFALQQAAVMLEPIVTTATGEQRRAELGHAVSQVNAAELVATRPVANMADLLTARAPGVQVLPPNQTGAGARVRIRGTSSLSLSNDPIYIIDGVRMESATESGSISVGGSYPSRVSDINPEEIESIEVVKGPSAATLYGTDAANGVIVIRTKRGQAGRPQWNIYAEQGIIEDRNDYPESYRGWRSGSTAANTVHCFLHEVARGACAQDSVTSYNLWEDPRATPLGTGNRQQYGLQVTGGSEAIRYFVAGEWEDETGVLQMPTFEVARLRGQGIDILDEWMRPNALERGSARVNLNVTLSPQADIALNTNYIRLSQRLPQSDDNTTGLGSNAFGGPGFRYNVGARGDTIFGYRTYTPGDIFQETTSQDVDRFIGGVNGNWRPSSWLATRANVGLDFSNRIDSGICRRNNCADFGTQRLGFKEDNRTTFHNYTVDVSGTGSFRLAEWLDTRTTVGAQYFRRVFDRNGAEGITLPPGSTQITDASVFEADESTSETRTLGAFVEEHLSIGDRLFVTAGIRSDRNSAFGADFATVFYPKLSASYILSEERFFPQLGWLDQLRLRGAYGASGVQPGTTDAVQFLRSTSIRTESGEIPGVVFSALGNRDLKPERSEELELGVEGAFLNGRLSTDVTYYNKTSRDALIERDLPPSLGTGTGNVAPVRFENLGEVRNWGWEALVVARLLDLESLGWELTVNGSRNSNRLVSLGGVSPIIGTTLRQIEGYPLNGYWERPLLGYADRNNDGVIGLDEIEVGAEAAYIGYSQPRTEIAVNNALDLFRQVRVSALVDYKGGHRLNNGTERIRCETRRNCRGLHDPTASLYEQARAVALTQHPSRTRAGYFEEAWFLRFRELALTWTVPESWASRGFRGRSLSTTLSARNLGFRSNYTGLDPESNFGQDDAPNDFQTAPPPTYLTLRVNVGF